MVKKIDNLEPIERLEFAERVWYRFAVQDLTSNEIPSQLILNRKELIDSLGQSKINNFKKAIQWPVAENQYYYSHANCLKALRAEVLELRDQITILEQA